MVLTGALWTAIYVSYRGMDSSHKRNESCCVPKHAWTRTVVMLWSRLFCQQDFVASYVEVQFLLAKSKATENPKKCLTNMSRGVLKELQALIGALALHYHLPSLTKRGASLWGAAVKN